jgi:hypothetical protein
VNDWAQQQQQPPECVASASPSSPSSNPSNGFFHDSLSQLNTYHDLDFLIDNPVWDPAVIALDIADPTPTSFVGGQDFSSLSAPALNLDLTSTFDPLAVPLLDCLPAAVAVPSGASTSAAPSLTSTPTTAPLQTPSPDSSSSLDNPPLYPGLKLPPAKKPSSSRPGRRPAATSLSRTVDGRVTKQTPGAGLTTHSTPRHHASVVVTEEEVDPEVLDRRYRNNLAAQRYRQKKIDRIQELEAEVRKVTEERDDLKIRLARQEAEIAALREMLKLKMGGGGDGY